MSSVIWFVVAVLVVGLLMLLVLSAVSKHKSVVLDTEKYQVRWMDIETSLVKDDVASYKLSVMEADKLLDHAMNELGVQGNTMGDRLKGVGDMFKSTNSVWHAHKLRNQIVHEQDFCPSYDQSRRALVAFKQGLRDLGAI